MGNFGFSFQALLAWAMDRVGGDWVVYLWIGSRLCSSRTRFANFPAPHLGLRTGAHFLMEHVSCTLCVLNTDIIYGCLLYLRITYTVYVCSRKIKCLSRRTISAYIYPLEI